LGKASRRKHKSGVDGTKSFHPNQLRKRLPNAADIIREVSVKTNCKECALCCTGQEGKGQKYIRVSREDPNYQNIARAVVSLQKEGSVTQAEQGMHLNFIGDHCPFLDAKSCEIYSISPFPCKTFPFNINPKISALQPGNRPVAFLDSTCPAVGQLKSRGVNAVFLTDLVHIQSTSFGNLLNIPGFDELASRLTGGLVPHYDLSIGCGFLGKSLVIFMDVLPKLTNFYINKETPPLLYLAGPSGKPEIVFPIV